MAKRPDNGDEFRRRRLGKLLLKFKEVTLAGKPCPICGSIVPPGTFHRPKPAPKRKRPAPVEPRGAA